MRKIILTVITTTLLLANATEETQVQAQVAQTKTEIKTVIEKAQKKVTQAQAEVKTKKDPIVSDTGSRLEIKKSKREAELEAELAKKELERADKAKIREEKLKKLDAELKAKADKRAGLVY